MNPEQQKRLARIRTKIAQLDKKERVLLKMIQYAAVGGLACSIVGFQFLQPTWVFKLFFLFGLGFFTSVLLYVYYFRTFSATKPPGGFLLICSEFILPKNYYTNVALPVVVDMRGEYFDALSQNRIWKARWVRIRGTYSFFAAIGLDRAFAFVSFFIKAWKSVN
jgi:hypothetical protein